MRFSFDDRLADEMRGEIPDAREMLVRIQKCEYTSLGTSIVDGVEAEGFHTTDPNYPEDGASRVDVSLWVDVKTGLPVRSEEDIEWNDGRTMRSVSHDFQWDVPVDPLLFQPMIPDGYANAGGGSIQIPAINEETAIQGLKFCLELGGRYPKALTEPALKSYARLPARAQRHDEGTGAGIHPGPEQSRPDHAEDDADHGLVDVPRHAREGARGTRCTMATR